MKLRSLFTVPSPESIARSELEDALREKLLSDSAADYAQAISSYNAQRIERLRAYIATFDNIEKNISKSTELIEKVRV